MLGQRAGPDAGAGLQPAYLLATRFFSSLCRHRPTIIALDDAHLSDDETLTALSLAARHLAQLPLFLVVSTRLDKWVPGSRFAATIGRLIDSGLGAVVDLGPLDPEDTTALIAADLPGRPDERLTAYVYSQSRGNPLFTRQALRSLQELGAIRSEHGVWYLVGNPATGSLSRRAALLHRVFQQDRPGRELARVMSAFRRVHLDHLSALEAVTDMNREAIEEAFDALTRASIITRVAMGWYEFAHPLIAEVLYNDLGPLERRRLHKLIAESFSDRPQAAGVDVLEWTTHVAEAATPGDPVAIAAVLNAAQLTRNSAPLSAATWYARPWTCSRPRRPSAAGCCRGRPSRCGRDRGPRRRSRSAAARWPPRTPATCGPGPWPRSINATYAMGRYNDGLAVVSEQLHSVADPAPFLAQQALMLAHMGRSAEAVRQLDQAQARAGPARRGAGGDLQLRRPRLQLPRRLRPGQRGHGPADADRAGGGARPGPRRPAQRAGVGVLPARGHRLPAPGPGDDGQGDRAAARDRLAGRRRAVHLRQGQDRGHDRGVGRRAGDDPVRRHQPGVRRPAQQPRVAAPARGGDPHRPGPARRGGPAPGDTAAAPECALYSVLHQVRAARIATALGQHGEAERMLAEQLAVAQDGGMAEAHRRCLEALVDLGLATGDQDATARYAAQLRDLATRTGIPATITAADMADIALGNVEAGERLVAEYEAEGRLFFAAQAHYYLAAFVPDPDEHLSRAIELFTSMGAQLWTPRAASQAKVLGLAVSGGRRRPRSKAGGPKTLSQTEIQLVQLLRQGLTNRQISAVMHYSAKTIEVYVSRLYQKVGYHSRLELVLAAERGELSVLPPEDLACRPPRRRRKGGRRPAPGRARA